MLKSLQSAASVHAFAATPEPQPRNTPDSVPAMIAELQKTFEEFKAANDERLDKKADAVVDDKVERINTALTELQAGFDKLSKQQARATVGGPSNDNVEIRAASRFFSAVRGQTVRPRDAAGEIETYREYCDAFEQLVRRGLNAEMLPGDIRNAASVGSDPQGGYFVPAEMSTEMERRIHDTSPMRQVARVIRIGSDAWEAPYKSSKGTSGGWVAERQSRPATGTGAVGVQRIPVHEQYAYPEVTQKMLDDAALDIEAFIVEDTEEEMSRTENTAFVSGDGVGKPRGFLDYKGAAVTTADASRDWGKLQYVASGAAGGFPKISGSVSDDPGALIDMITALHPTYRANGRWAMNRSTEAAVRKLRDAEGRYLVGFGDIREASTGFLLHNYPIANFEDMPDIGSNSYSIAFGDWRRGYYVIDRVGFRLLRDPYTNKPYVGFYIDKRVGGDVRNFDAIKLMKFATS